DREGLSSHPGLEEDLPRTGAPRGNHTENGSAVQGNRGNTDEIAFFRSSALYIMNNFQKLLDIMASLRAEDGCPWDREQTRESLTPYLVEETYEVLEAIDEGSPQKIKEELGDLLFQIVFHCQLAKERGEFSMEDVIDAISKKMTGRHPHVFGDAKFETSEKVMKQWEERKKEEGKNRESILEGVPKELPALLKA